MSLAPQSRPATHWPSLLLAIWCGIAILLLAGYSLITLISGLAGVTDPATGLAGATGPAAGVLLLIPGLLICLRRARAGTDAERPGLPAGIESWLDRLILPLWILSLLAGALTANTRVAWLLLPLLSLPVFGLPVLWLARRGIQRLGPIPRWQTWGVFAIGLSATPIILIVLELIAIAFIALISLVLHPELAEAMWGLAEQLQTMNPDQLVETLSGYILTPGVLLAVFAMISVIGPLLEEAIKPLGIWLLAGQVRTPAHGFLLGALSGAAYSLVEGLGNAGAAGSSLALVALGRSGTSMMHILTSALVGWALVRAWQERRFGQLAAVYALAVVVHGLWNALGVLITVGTLGGERLAFLSPVSVGGLGGLALLLLLAFLRSTRAPAPAQETQQQV